MCYLKNRKTEDETPEETSTSCFPYLVCVLSWRKRNVPIASSVMVLVRGMEMSEWMLCTDSFGAWDKKTRSRTITLAIDVTVS